MIFSSTEAQERGATATNKANEAATVVGEDVTSRAILPR